MRSGAAVDLVEEVEDPQYLFGRIGRAGLLAVTEGRVGNPDILWIFHRHFDTVEDDLGKLGIGERFPGTDWAAQCPAVCTVLSCPFSRFDRDTGDSIVLSFPAVLLIHRSPQGSPLPNHGIAEEGIEPSRPFRQGILSPQRLPFRHSARFQALTQTEPAIGTFPARSNYSYSRIPFNSGSGNLRPSMSKQKL